MLLTRLALATVVHAELFNPSKRGYTSIESAQVKKIVKEKFYINPNPNWDQSFYLENRI